MNAAGILERLVLESGKGDWRIPGTHDIGHPQLVNRILRILAAIGRIRISEMSRRRTGGVEVS